LFRAGVKVPVNQAGIDYYNDLINQLLAAGIEPHITMYHWDTPLALSYFPNVLAKPDLSDDHPNALLAPDFPTWFSDYATILFDSFGDRVKQWVTFNEPWCSAVLYSGSKQNDRDPYRIGHNILLAHCQAVHIYRENYQEIQKGTIGIVLNTCQFYPKDSSNADDIEATTRAIDFHYGWFLLPLMKGNYPQIMFDICGERLPKFSEEESFLLKGSIDFLGINYYTSNLSTPAKKGKSSSVDKDGEGSYWKDVNVENTSDPKWSKTYMDWGIHATGLKDLLLYTSEHYPDLPLWVTENGMAWKEPTSTIAINDKERQLFIHDHIEAIGQAIQEGGVNVKGYFYWSLQDNFEWLYGYDKRFGLVYIERPSLKRVIKNSFHYYSKIITTHNTSIAAAPAAASSAKVASSSEANVAAMKTALVNTSTSSSLVENQQKEKDLTGSDDVTEIENKPEIANQN
jgi:beta-glucosidase/6-phospho-beta-glucosidase/beta-galactosidase